MAGAARTGLKVDDGHEARDVHPPDELATLWPKALARAQAPGTRWPKFVNRDRDAETRGELDEIWDVLPASGRPTLVGQLLPLSNIQSATVASAGVRTETPLKVGEQTVGFPWIGLIHQGFSACLCVVQSECDAAKNAVQDPATLAERPSRRKLGDYATGDGFGRARHAGTHVITPGTG